ncbi:MULTISPECIES: hypothetical protein [unclassified Oceanobacter]|uniref:hypothetical protein n=1 Tax=unclassified Oceanobacter TaxID=2620260 RepID=UPI0027368F36|nr:MULTISPECIES: hypothetical protein [unclassified Oceanobacter]MDP2607650.1 hypothetical protein [Oceanobacter sp. 1_MG-2023]MDP2611166.1 hypothetical protein [Oceanobacter sp. 2_MG-2023]
MLTRNYRSPWSWLLASTVLMAGFVQSEDWHIRYTQDIHAWSGAMAVAEITNDWNGTLKDDDDGFLWMQTSASVGYGAFSVAYISRHHAEYEFSNALARGFYYQANDVALDQVYEVEADVHARHYQGEGLNLSWVFAAADNRRWSITPSVTWLRLYRLIWGEVSGTLNYLDADHWGGDLDVDYGYTEDKIPLERTLAERSYGDLYSLDLAFHWHWQQYQIDYQGYNLLARIDWPDMPGTIANKNWQYDDGSLTTDSGYFVYGYEFYEDRVLRPPRLHTIRQRYGLSDTLAVTLRSYLNQIRQGHELGLRWQAADLAWMLAVDSQGHAFRAGLHHPKVQLELLSERVNISRSRLLALQFGITHTF